tara:strand:+ start:605 stop:1141 length:537 start_codon:yes stop_codon:yes gene_type:complete
MAITLRGDGFQYDSELNLKVDNTDTVETHGLAGGSTNSDQYCGGHVVRSFFSGYPNGGHGEGSVWNNYTMSEVGSGNSTNSGFNASTGRFTAPKTGCYILTMSGITHNGSSDTRFAINLNGNNNASHTISDRQTGSYSPTVISTTWYLNQGDYAECMVYGSGQAHGGSWNHFAGVQIA